MIHLAPLIKDLALILIAAAVTTLIFKRLRQPLVLGYIVAGLLVGQHVSLVPTVTDEKNIHVWSEIGVIFLLFSLGLEFSFKKLIKVGGAASISALVEVVFMLALGYLLGQIMGWSPMDSIFLGGIISISSTTIIIRAFEELGVKGLKFAGLVFGILVVEDLVAIVLLVLLSTLAVSRQFEGGAMLISVVKLVFFLIAWFVTGIFFIPTLLRMTKKIMNEETLLVTSVGLCLLMVVLATQVGFSPALGAFIMGSILAETTQAEKIEHLVKPVKELFGAVFFISVGMLINPAMLVKYAVPVLIITVVTLIGKTLSTGIGALLSGQPLKTSVQAGMSLAQIGEFSFIIAQLGLTLNVTSEFLYPVAVAVSAVTTFTTPYMIKLSGPVYEKLAELMPHRWKTAINRYSAAAQTISVVSDWKILLRSYFTNVIIYTVVILAIILLSSYYLLPMSGVYNWGRAMSAVLTFLLLMPFLWALGFRNIASAASNRIWEQKKYRGPLMLLRLARIVIAIFLLGFFIDRFYSYSVALAVTAIMIVLIFVFRHKIGDFYTTIEERFFSNFNARETKVGNISKSVLAPWDAHLAVSEIKPLSPVAGSTLEDLQLRENYGINIALINRSGIKMYAPDKYARLFPGDVVTAIGTDEQLQKFNHYLEPAHAAIAVPVNDGDPIALKQFLVTAQSPLEGKTIREAGIRERTSGIVLGIERKGQRLLNPASLTVLQAGDIVWIAGSGGRLHAWLKEINSKPNLL
ncbi:cation:proton antiporter [Chitinophaga sancti]|uniref:Cation:proton antiporter n=1 Tax=Chitinophaga sancti TaxID=1004 RepID=A0A1K1RYC2_9BACT|nr:cation:proton antiporter [Chitinophaga sancti]WQG90309.1 cation:proton antiporter [Chitinophaga sancti]SFW76837.1 monovalent cation:H+ antiporter-2, CPA2 family [Chitinophaga sancti]